jgi:hypothetical protein
VRSGWLGFLGCGVVVVSIVTWWGGGLGFSGLGDEYAEWVRGKYTERHFLFSRSLVASFFLEISYLRLS